MPSLATPFARVRTRGLSVIAVFALFPSCSGRAPAREVTPRDVLARAESRIEGGDHLKAIELLTKLTVDHPGLAYIDRVVYQLGVAYLESKSYVEAEAQFRRLGRDYPFSEYADDARFLIGEGYFRQRGSPQLDPTMAETALAEFQRFLREHPESDRVPDAREKIRIVREFLAEKQLLNARHYFRRKRWKASALYLRSLLDTYPDATIAPEGAVLLARALVELEDTIGACEALAGLDDLPAAPRRPDAAREGRELSRALGCAGATAKSDP